MRAGFVFVGRLQFLEDCENVFSIFFPYLLCTQGCSLRHPQHPHLGTYKKYIYLGDVIDAFSRFVAVGWEEVLDNLPLSSTE